jgi:hypothetical protein
MDTQVAISLTILVLNCLIMLAYFLILRSRFSKARMLSDIREEVDKLVVDLGREADRDVAILESRIKNLRALIDEADKRVLLADREAEKRRGEGEAMRELSNRSRDGVMVEPVTIAEPIIERKQKGPDEVSLEARAQTGSTPNEPVKIYTRPRVISSDRKIEPFIPIQERVLDMARQGFSAEMIAGNLSLSLGEVELIIDMNSSSL